MPVQIHPELVYLACAGSFLLSEGVLKCPGSWRAGLIFPVAGPTDPLSTCPSPCPSSDSSGLGWLPESSAGSTLLGAPSCVGPPSPGLGPVSKPIEFGTLIDSSLNKFACFGLSALWEHSSQADRPLTEKADWFLLYPWKCGSRFWGQGTEQSSHTCPHYCRSALRRRGGPFLPAEMSKPTLGPWTDLGGVWRQGLDRRSQEAFPALAIPVTSVLYCL